MAIINSKNLIWFGGFVIGSEVVWQLLLLLHKRYISSSSNNSNPNLNEKDNIPQGSATETVSIRPLTLKVENELDLRKPPDLWNTVLFCPDPTFRVGYQLLGYFEDSWVSIDLCIFLASIPELYEVLTKKKRQGVKIRVITDYDTMTAHNNCVCYKLKKADIPVRIKSTGTLMHNKFVIFDEEAVLAGSGNFTKMAIKQNNENIIVTTNPEIVQLYLDEFNKIWEYFGEPKN